MSKRAILTGATHSSELLHRGSFASYSPIAGSKRQLSSTIGCLVQFNTVGRRLRLPLFALPKLLRAINKNCMEATPTKVRFWKRKGFLYTVGILFVVGIVVSAVDDQSPSTQTSTAQPAVAQQPADAKPVSSATVSRGEEGYIKGTSGTPNEILTKTKADYDVFIDILLSKDTIGLGQFLQDDRGFGVANGTKVLVIGTAVGVRQVRVLEGEHLGESGWLAMEYVSKTK